jgi:hypothetical protein
MNNNIIVYGLKKYFLLKKMKIKMSRKMSNFKKKFKPIRFIFIIFNSY